MISCAVCLSHTLQYRIVLGTAASALIKPPHTRSIATLMPMTDRAHPAGESNRYRRRPVRKVVRNPGNASRARETRLGLGGSRCASLPGARPGKRCTHPRPDAARSRNHKSAVLEYRCPRFSPWSHKRWVWMPLHPTARIISTRNRSFPQVVLRSASRYQAICWNFEAFDSAEAIARNKAGVSPTSTRTSPAEVARTGV